MSCCIYYSSSWPCPLVIWSTSNSIRQHNRACESGAVSNHHRGRERGGEGDDDRICREITHSLILKMTIIIYYGRVILFYILLVPLSSQSMKNIYTFSIAIHRALLSYLQKPGPLGPSFRHLTLCARRAHWSVKCRMNGGRKRIRYTQ